MNHPFVSRMGTDADKESTLNVDQLINLSLFPERNAPNEKPRARRKKRKHKSTTPSSTTRSASVRSGSQESVTESTDTSATRREGRENDANTSTRLKYELLEGPSYISVSMKLPDDVNPRDLRFRFVDESQEIRITGRNFELPIWLNRPDVIVSQTVYHIVGLQLDTLELQVPKVPSVQTIGSAPGWYSNTYNAYPGFQGNYQDQNTIVATAVPHTPYFFSPDPSQGNYVKPDGRPDALN